MQREALIAQLDTLLKPKLYRDYAPNGLQIEGRSEIQRVVTAVSVCKESIDFAIDFNADALLVHHGFFWKGESLELTGLKRARIASLLAHDINLIAYHLPLDQHANLGNNVLFGQALGFEDIRQSQREPMIWYADVAMSCQALSEKIAQTLGRAPLMVGKKEHIQRVAWCTGAAQDYFAQAVSEGADAFLSGEYAERTYYEANELNALYYSCGHHATERFGVRALGEYLQARYDLSVEFIDSENPF